MIHLITLFSLGPLLYELPLSALGMCSALYFISFRKIEVPYWLQQGLAVFCGLMIYFLHGTLQTPEAASSLIATAVCLKLLSLKTNRDQMILLLINLIAVMCYILFAQTLLSTVLLLANYLLFILHLLHLQKQKLGLPTTAFNLKQLLSPETLIALPLLIALFIFFPRFTTPWSGLAAAPENQVMGFSQDLNPGLIQNLAESDRIAFRVLFKNNTVTHPESLYFRGSVLSENNEWSWKGSKETFKIPKLNQEISTNEKNLIYEILLEPRFDKVLFSLDATSQISLQPESLEYAQSDEGEFNLRWPAVSKVKINGYRTSAQEKLPPPQDPTPFLQINSVISPQMKQLIEPLQGQSQELKLKSILNFFSNNNFKYSLQTPSYPTLDSFLFGERVGFCEHFAASFAVLARMAGLPTRVVTGFQGAEYNSFGTYFLVRDKQAHAWNEVYLSDKGWLRVDVTDIVAPERIRGGALYSRLSGALVNETPGFFARAFMAWDAINNRYNLLLMNYNLENQVALVEKFSLSKIKLKTFYSLFALIVLFFVFIFWRLSLRGKAEQDNTTKGYILLNQKIQKLGILRMAHEGPNDLRQKLLKLSQPPAKVLDLLDRYTLLRFGSNASPQESKRFYKDVKALKVYK